MKEERCEALVVPVAYAGINSGLYDLTVLLLPDGHRISVGRTGDASHGVLVLATDRHRLAFLRRVHQIIQLRLQDAGSSRSVGNLILHLRKFWGFCQSHSAIPTSFSPSMWSRIFADWVQWLWHRVGTKQLVERSAGTYAWSIANLIAEVFEMSTAEFVGRTLMPRINVSAASDRYENLNLPAIDQFLADLDDIANSIPTEFRALNWPYRIQFRDGTAYVFPFVGKPANCTGRSATEAERARLLKLRTETEILRFIGATGCNLQVATDLVIGDVSFESFGNAYNVHGLKNRRNDFVHIRVPRFYKAKLEAWIEFRSKAFSEGASRLFPLFARAGKESSLAAEQGFPTVRRVLQSQGKQVFGAMELRFARAQRLLRAQAVGLNLDVISNELQNSVATIHRSYLRGNQQMSAVEFGKFVSTISSKAGAQRLRNGGACEKPEHPQRVEVAKLETPEPNCANPAGCFFCSNFRAVADGDSVHAMLSYRQFLRVRGSLCAEDREVFLREIAPTIERVNDFVAAIVESENTMASTVERLEKMTDAGHYHRHWHGWIELATLTGP